MALRLIQILEQLPPLLLQLRLRLKTECTFPHDLGVACTDFMPTFEVWPPARDEPNETMRVGRARGLQLSASYYIFYFTAMYQFDLPCVFPLEGNNNFLRVR